MYHKRLKDTRPIYTKQDNLHTGLNERLWHIVPPDPTRPDQLNDTSWCGRYVITQAVLTTEKPARTICRLCLRHRKLKVIREAFI